MKNDSSCLNVAFNHEVNGQNIRRHNVSSSSMPIIYMRERLQLRAIVPSFTASAILAILLSISTSFAGTATWKASPGSGDWNTASNWTPSTIPNDSSDTATFAFSNTTGVSLSAVTQFNGLVFNAGASAFTITVSSSFPLTITGVGITNNSGITQNFVTTTVGHGSAGEIEFINSATAGSGTFFTNTAGASVHELTGF